MKGFLLFVPFLALANFSYETSIASNFVWRGVTQTQKHAAVSGRVQYDHDLGLYAGIWGSNADLAEGATAWFELYAGGIAYINEDISVSGQVIRYEFPSVSARDHYEFNIGGRYRWSTLDFYYTDRAFGTSTAGLYTTVNVEVPLSELLNFGIYGLDMNLHAGYYGFDSGNLNSYYDYGVDIGKAINERFSISAHFSDTNDRLFKNLTNSSWDDAQFWLKLTARFS